MDYNLNLHNTINSSKTMHLYVQFHNYIVFEIWLKHTIEWTEKHLW